LRRSGDDEARALELAAAGKLTFELTSIPLEQASRALDLSRGGHVRGKLVLIP
jgi:D-arabinose 1-dehydrogenase-like Zn-dependent alcohol dehydrogenase